MCPHHARRTGKRAPALRRGSASWTVSPRDARASPSMNQRADSSATRGSGRDRCRLLDGPRDLYARVRVERRNMLRMWVLIVFSLKTADGFGLDRARARSPDGWPMAVAVSRPQDLPNIGIPSGARLRQWQLDLIMLGSLTEVAPLIVPNPPRRAPCHRPSTHGSTPTPSECWRSAPSSKHTLSKKQESRPRSRRRHAASAALVVDTWKRWLNPR